MSEVQTEPVSYDDLPYEGVALPSTHPQHLAMVARLFGMDTAPAGRCRVLELGCGTGGNIVPMAQELPGSSFTGIDLSAVEIAEARRWARILGVSNLALEQMDIRDVDAGFGEFDYIIAYGVYSWVPEHVRDSLWRICRENLAPEGVAMISYNVFPGWHLRMGVRQMMLYHSLRFPAEERTQQALGLLEFLRSGTEALDGRLKDIGIYHDVLEREAGRLREKPSAYLAHEHLSGANDPLYFSEFVTRAAAAGLNYLADADFGSMLTSSLPPTVAEQVEAVASDRVSSEQYMDFLTNRTFRESLLCHAEVPLTMQIPGSALQHLHMASAASFLEPGHERYERERPKIRSVAGTIVSVKTAAAVAALQVLTGTWPQAMTFEALLEETAKSLGQTFETADVERLANTLVTLFAMKVVEFRTEPVRCVAASRAGERPLASEVARLQAVVGPAVTNLRHDTVDLDLECRAILPLLDGTRTRSELASVLNTVLEADGQPGAYPTAEALSVAVDGAIERLGRLSLLAG